jgi:hypothetical protein
MHTSYPYYDWVLKKFTKFLLTVIFFKFSRKWKCSTYNQTNYLLSLQCDSYMYNLYMHRAKLSLLYMYKDILKTEDKNLVVVCNAKRRLWWRVAGRTIGVFARQRTLPANLTSVSSVAPSCHRILIEQKHGCVL